MSKVEIPIAYPLDPEGFFRRECPSKSCVGQFKVFPDGVPDQDEYFCPICAAHSAANSWWTPQQLRFQKEHARKYVEDKLLKPIRTKMGEVANSVNRNSRGLFKMKATFKAAPPTVPNAPTEPNDGRIVKPPCHPDARLKVADDWSGTVHCFACGLPVPQSSSSQP